jgi:phage-related protein
MATFTYMPSFTASESSQPLVRKVQFGDGYSQRLRYGLNTDPKSWRLTFLNRNDAERENILTFFEARAGSESFDWTPPRGSAGKYICSEWNMDMLNCNNNTITATFVEVFES